MQQTVNRAMAQQWSGGREVACSDDAACFSTIWLCICFFSVALARLAAKLLNCLSCFSSFTNLNRSLPAVNGYQGSYPCVLAPVYTSRALSCDTTCLSS
jgi:hypothetical protein